MKLKDYIFSKGSSICFIGIGAIFIGIYMTLAGTRLVLIVSGLLLYLFIFFMYFTVNYIISEKRIRRLQKMVATLDKKYLAAELLEKPVNPVEAEYYYVMKEISRSAISIIENEERDKNDYYNYVENWIHEMKTPLTACSLILDNDGDRKKLRKELKRADNLMDTILYYARLRSINRDLKIRRTELSEVINEAVKSEMELLIAAGIRIEITGNQIVNTDDKMIGFIIRQFLVNSAKYCKNCTITITIGENTIEFMDNGVGIPSHEIMRVKERGFTGTNGRTCGNSTGMGLYIVDELCKELSIDWEITSVAGSYTKHILKMNI